MKTGKVGIAIAAGVLLLMLSGCGSSSSNAKDSSSAKVSSSKHVSKSSSSAKSSSPATSSSQSESESTQSSAVSSSTSESSQSSATSSATATITNADQAVAAVKAAEESGWQARVNGPLVFGYIGMTTIDGQQAYRVDIGTNNGRSTVASYGVFANGKVVLIKTY